jgi:hypothetical protein
MEKFAATGFSLELNTVKFNVLSAKRFLTINNDLNTSTSCFDVDFTTISLLTIHALLFCDLSLRNLRIESSMQSVHSTLLSMVQLAALHGLYGISNETICFSLGEIVLIRSTFAYYQKKKFDKMNEWVYIPFHMFECNKRYNHYNFVAKHDKILCVDCSLDSINKKCSIKRSKKDV